MKIIKKFNSIAEAYRAGCIKENTMIKTNANGIDTTCKTIKGIIGEINTKYKKMYIWHNNKTNEGLRGKKNPKIYGYKYSWVVDLKNKIAKIEIETEYEVKKSIDKINPNDSHFYILDNKKRVVWQMDLYDKKTEIEIKIEINKKKIKKITTKQKTK